MLPPRHQPTRSDVLPVRDLGRLAYVPALAEQRRVHAAVVAGDAPSTLLLVEHEPVITMGRRAKAEHIIANTEALGEQGVEVIDTDRGGDVTYHGPGQLVAYPIIHLREFGLNLRTYVRALEQAIIDTAGTFGITAERDACAVGVWVPLEPAATAKPQPAGCEVTGGPASNAKLAAIGVRAERHVTLHGLALNIAPRMAHFNLIVPCGLAGRPVTSMADLLGEACPKMAHVKARLTENISRALLGS